MKNKRIKYALVFVCMTSAVFATLSPTIAAEARPGKNPQTKPPHKTVKEQIQVDPSTTINLLDYYNNLTTVDPGAEICAELNQLAAATGHNPVRQCSGYTNTNPNQTSNPTDPEPDTQSPPTGPEPVLFIHGFDFDSGHDCADNYWQEQKDEVFKQQPTRDTRTVGWYWSNENCDEQISTDSSFNNNKSLADVADALYEWIDTEYGDQPIDIVAHSMGGLVVRKMITEYGPLLRISDVVTLGTPHDGVKTHVGIQAPILYIACLPSQQCKESRSGSSFMNSLVDNPQSQIPTQWTLIGAASDLTIGPDTATTMSDGNEGGPQVNTYAYKNKATYQHKHTCSPFVNVIGHGDLHGDNGSKDVFPCNGWQVRGDPVANPTQRVLNAIN